MRLFIFLISPLTIMVSDTAGARGDLMGQLLSNPHRNTKYGLAEHLLKRQFLQSKLKSKSSKWVRDEYYKVYINACHVYLLRTLL